MDENQKRNQENDTIDLISLLKSLWRKAWAIALITIIVGAGAFGFTKLFIKPKYKSHVSGYIKASLTSQINITLNRSLVDTCIVILSGDQVLLRIQEEAMTTSGVEVSVGTLRSIISAGAVNDTEIIRITVTSDSSKISIAVAKAIDKVLPEVIREFKDFTLITWDHSSFEEGGATVVKPNITKNVVIGMLVGFMASCVLFAVITLLDDTIHGEEYVTERYNIPILAKIPNLLYDGSSDGYYKRSKYRYKYYQSKYQYQPSEKKSSESEENA